MTNMSIEIERFLEETEADYLFERTLALTKITNNPYHAEIFKSGPHEGFIIGESPGPMNNRLCGMSDSSSLPPELLTKFHSVAVHVHIPLIGNKKSLKEKAKNFKAEPVRGWVHGQFFANITHLETQKTPHNTRQLYPNDMDIFIKLHSDAFNAMKKHHNLALDMFKGLLQLGCAEAYAVEVNNIPIAIGLYPNHLKMQIQRLARMLEQGVT